MPEDAAVKISVLRIRNDSERRRRLTLTAFVEWTLGGAARTDSCIRCRRGTPPTTARSSHGMGSIRPRRMDGVSRVQRAGHQLFADRLTFLGDVGDPAALHRDTLDGETGSGRDPCGALQMQLVLAPGESRDVVILLGAAGSERGARRTMTRLRTPASARQAIAGCIDAWRSGSA